jgi:undecaprenyl-diphosphatase
VTVDRRLLVAIARLRRPWLGPWVRRYSLLGNYGIGWVAVGLVAGIAEGSPRRAITVVAATWTALGANYAVKSLVRRDRPGGRDGLPAPLIVAPSSHSFPSAHAAMSVAAAIVLGPLAWPFALLMATSRLYLAVHWPSDVLVGALLGCAVGLAAATLGA